MSMPNEASGEFMFIAGVGTAPGQPEETCDPVAVEGLLVEVGTVPLLALAAPPA
jgi:hypothetical protein